MRNPFFLTIKTVLAQKKPPARITNVIVTDSGRRAEGFCGETNDCTVRATAILLNQKYAEAHAALAQCGRKPKDGFNYPKAAKKLGLQPRPEFSCKTVQRVLQELPPGRFVLRISKHVFAVVDGVVYDTWLPKAKARVKMVYSRPE
jgi:hypothetical protein